MHLLVEYTRYYEPGGALRPPVLGNSNMSKNRCECLHHVAPRLGLSVVEVVQIPFMGFGLYFERITLVAVAYPLPDISAVIQEISMTVFGLGRMDRFVIDGNGAKGLELFAREYDPEQHHGLISAKRDQGVVDDFHFRIVM